MDYDSYKERVLKAKHVKNIILKFKWLIISFIFVVIGIVITISILKGSISSIELASEYTYGDSFDIKAIAKMSEVLNYEYKEESENTWTTNKPYKVGKYNLRVTTNGLFGKKKKIYSFSIEKKDLSIDVLSNTITYGDKPECEPCGLVYEDSIDSITFTYADKIHSSNKLYLDLSNVSLINKDGEDVSSCYNITSNASEGKEITFKPLSLVLEPEISNKEYDGLPQTLSNTYTIKYNKETGNDDVISVTTSFYKDGVSIDAPVNVGDYQVKIDSVLINNSDTVNNQNYKISTTTKNFSITKRNINISTASDSKTYDKTSLSNLNYTLNSTLAYGNTISVKEGTSILDYGTIDNKLDFEILDSTGLDVTNFYNITYNFGTLSISKKDIYATTNSSEFVYDSLEHNFISYYTDELLGEETIRVKNSASITNAGEKKNVIELEVLNSDSTLSSNYNFIYNYGTLKVIPQSISIKPKEKDNVIYSGSILTNPQNQEFDLISGKIYNDEISYVNLIYKSELYKECKNVGEYIIEIEEIDNPNYLISYLTNTFSILKEDVTIKPKNYSKTFDYQNALLDTSDFEILNGSLYENDKDKINLNLHFEQNNNNVNEMYHAGNYSVILDSLDTSDLILNNYNFSFENSTCEILMKDVTISLTNQSEVYQKCNLSYDFSKIDSSDELIKDLINVKESHSSSSLFNTGIYSLYIDSYEFINTDTIYQSDYLITTLSATFEILKRNIEINVSDISPIIYDGTEYKFNSDDFQVLSGSFCVGDEIEVNIIDKDLKNIKNADTYNLIISSISDNLNDNYNIINCSIDESKEFIIKPLDINITLENEEYVYDGYTHEPNCKYSSDKELLNNDSINLSVYTKTTLLDAGEYLKSATVIFSAGDTDSLKSNYSFNINPNAIIKILKRDISVKLKDYTEFYYMNYVDSYYYDYETYLTSDQSVVGLADNDTLNIKSIKLSASEIKLLSVGQYCQKINSISISRNNKDILNLDYNVVLVDSTITIVARPVTIKPVSQSIVFDKEYHDTTNLETIVIDYNNLELNKLPDLSNYTINSYFELNGSTFTKIIDANTYNIKIDSINEDLSNYDISFLDASYIISPLDVCPYISDITITYDAMYHTLNNLEELSYITSSHFIDARVSYSLNEEYSYKDAGTYYYYITINSITNTSLKEELKDYTDLLSNYNIINVSSIYIIKERDIYIDLYDQEKVYDGSKFEYDLSKIVIYDFDKTTLIENVSSLIFDELKSITFNVKYNNTPKNANSYTMVISSITKLKNYNITSLGNTHNLIISKRHISFSSNGITYNYEYYQEYFDPNYTISVAKDDYLESLSLGEKNNIFEINGNKFSINRINKASLYKVGKVLDSFEAKIILNDIDVTKNFDISYNFINYIEVIAQNIEVSVVSSYQKEYDSSNLDLLSLINITFEYDSLYTDNVEVYSYNILDLNNVSYTSIINANTYNFSLNEIRLYAYFDKEKIDVTDSYNITYVNLNCEIAISKVSLLISTNSYTFVWDGKDKTYEEGYSIERVDDNSSYTFPEENVNLNFAVLKAYNEDQKLLNYETPNSLSIDIFDKDNNSLNDNYVFTTNFGTLSYYKNYELHYNMSSDYNSNYHILNNINLDVWLNDDLNTLYSAEGSVALFSKNNETYLQIINVGKYSLSLDTNSIKLYVNDIEITYQDFLDNNIDLKYDLTYEIKALDILAIISQTNFDYTGIEQEVGYNINFSIDSNYKELADGDVLELYSSLKGTTPGFYGYKSIDSASVYKMVDGKKIDVSENYNILNLNSRYNSKFSYMASLYINQCRLNIIGTTHFTYDGQYHSAILSNIDEIEKIIMANNHTYVPLSYKDCGSYNIFKICDELGNDVTSYYSINSNLYIEKCEIILDVSQNIFDYDTFKHKLILKNLTEVKNKVLNNNHTIDFVEEINNGVYDPIKIYDESGKNVTNNYNIIDTKKSSVKLVIEKSTKLYLDVNNTSFTYDGKPHKLDIKNIDSLVKQIEANGHTYMPNELTNVGEVSPLLIYDNGKDITSNYSFVDSNGLDILLSVVEYNLILDVKKSTFDFDNSEKCIEINNFEEFESIISLHNNTYEYVYLTYVNSDLPFKIYNDAGLDVTSNYAILDKNLDYVYLTINPSELIVDVLESTFDYDNKEHQIKINNFDELNTKILNSNLKLSYNSLINVDSITPFNIKDNTGLDITDNYTFINSDLDYVYLTINPKVVTIETDKNSFVYDGKPHTISIKNKTYVESIIGSYYKINELTEVGSLVPITVYNQSFDLDITSNYSFVDHDGNEIYINVDYPSDIILDVKSYEFEYDGSEHKIQISNFSSIEKIIKENNQTIEYATLTNVDSIIPFVIYDASGNDVTNNYNFVDSNGDYVYLSVYECSITLDFNVYTFNYDGSEHKVSINNETKIRDILKKHGNTFEYNTLTNVGSINPIEIYNSKKENVTYNYKILDLNLEEAQLIVRSELKTIYLDIEICNFTYNGFYQSIIIKNDYSSYLNEGDSLTLKQYKDVGLYFAVQIINKDNEDVTSYYNFVDASNNSFSPTISITKENVYIEVTDNTFKYDGKEHSLDIISVQGLCSDHTYEIISEKKVGKYVPIIIYDSDLVDVTSNYNIDTYLVIEK